MKSEFLHTPEEYWKMFRDGCRSGKATFNLPHGCTEEDKDIVLAFFCYLMAVSDSPVEELPADDDDPFCLEGYKLISVSSFMRFYPFFSKVAAKRIFDRGVELFVTGVNPQKMDAGFIGSIIPGAEISYSPTVSIEVKGKRFKHLTNIVIGSCVITHGKRSKRYVHLVNDLFNLGGEPPRVKAIRPKEALLVTEAQHDD